MISIGGLFDLLCGEKQAGLDRTPRAGWGADRIVRNWSSYIAGQRSGPKRRGIRERSEFVIIAPAALARTARAGEWRVVLGTRSSRSPAGAASASVD